MDTAVEILTPVAFFSVLAFWRPNTVLFMLAGAVSLFTGLYWYDTFNTPLGMTVALCLVAYCLLCFGYAFRNIFWKSEN